MEAPECVKGRLSTSRMKQIFDLVVRARLGLDQLHSHLGQEGVRTSHGPPMISGLACPQRSESSVLLDGHR